MDLLLDIGRCIVALVVTGLLGVCVMLHWGEHCAGSRTRRARREREDWR